MRRDSGFPLRFRDLERHLTLGKLSAACRYHPVVFIVIGGMGDRTKVDGSDRMWLRRHPIFVTSNSGEFTIAAQANVLFFMEALAEAECFLQKGALNDFSL